MREVARTEQQDKKTQFAQQKLVEYLGSIGAGDVDELGQDQTEEIFLQAIKDFKAENISLADLSFISGKLWWSAVEKNKEFDKKTLDILHIGGEIDFYSRKVLEPKLDSIFLGFVKDLLEFYEEKNRKKTERVG